MSNYTKTTDFSAKDDLPGGDPDKVVVGAELDAEFDAIATAVATKANSASVPTLSGQNTFTSTQIISSTQPVLRFYETDGGSDEKLWSVFVDASGFVISTREDDNAAGIQAFTAVRGSGTAISSVSLRAGVADQLKLLSSGALTFTNGTVTGQLSYSVTPTFQFGSSSSHNLDLVAGGTTRLTVRTDSTVTQAALTVATLPAAAGLSGARAFVTDANATTFASIVAGGGSNRVPVYCDGTNWRIG